MLAAISHGTIGKFQSVVVIINTGDEIDGDRVNFCLRLHHIKESVTLEIRSTS